LTEIIYILSKVICWIKRVRIKSGRAHNFLRIS